MFQKNERLHCQSVPTDGEFLYGKYQQPIISQNGSNQLVELTEEVKTIASN